MIIGHIIFGGKSARFVPFTHYYIFLRYPRPIFAYRSYDTPKQYAGDWAFRMYHFTNN